METTKRNKILPKEGKRNVLITSALPYVNNVPHLGNIVGSVLSADVFSRYSKARGYQTLFVCGTDEYGTATETKALEEGITPQELCDKYHAIHSQVYEWFNIGFDYFGRTPTQQQTDITQDIFLKLYKNGYLEEKTTVQPYCEKHSSFLADRFVEGECPFCSHLDARGDQCDKCGKLLEPLDLKNPRCKVDGATPKARETKHIYILLDKLQPAVQEWVEESSTTGAWSNNGVQITQSWLNEGLKARGITRDLKWGTAVPLEGYENKVIYVWFDACIGYVSITANYTEDWEKWWRNPENVQLYQFMGKDNVPFHTVIFPGSQIGTGDKWTKLHHLSTTEYLNYEHSKFSKSRGIGVFGTNAKETGIPSDVWRWYLMSRRPESGDGEFEWKAFIDANNNELLKNPGNFINRVILFVQNYCQKIVPNPKTTIKMADRGLGDKTPNVDESNWKEYLERWLYDANEQLKQYIALLEAVKIKAGAAKAMNISSLGNALLQNQGISAALLASQPERCSTVIYFAANWAHLFASIIEPYMPATSASILKQLNLQLLTIPDSWYPNSIEPDHRIGDQAYLFDSIKPSREMEWRELYGGEEARKARAEKAAKAAVKKAQTAAKKTVGKGKGGNGK